MEFIYFVVSSSGRYSYNDSSGLRMTILGDFLSSDVRCGSSSFKEWSLNDKWNSETNGNLTALEKNDSYIFLSDLFSDEESPTQLKMTRVQFVKLLDDWQEKVCKLKPKEVIIKYENDEFIIETKD